MCNMKSVAQNYQPTVNLPMSNQMSDIWENLLKCGAMYSFLFEQWW